MYYNSSWTHINILLWTPNVSRTNSWSEGITWKTERGDVEVGVVIWRCLEYTHGGNLKSSFYLHKHPVYSILWINVWSVDLFQLCVHFVLIYIHTSSMDFSSIFFLSAILIMEHKGKELFCMFCVVSFIWNNFSERTKCTFPDYWNIRSYILN